MMCKICLFVCSTLKIIHLDENNVSLDGLKAIARAMTHNKSIISILPVRDVYRLQRITKKKRDKDLLEKYIQMILDACQANKDGVSAGSLQRTDSWWMLVTVWRAGGSTNVIEMLYITMGFRLAWSIQKLRSFFAWSPWSLKYHAKAKDSFVCSKT